MEEIQVQLLGQEDSLEEDMATHPVFLHGGSHGQRSLVDCGSWGHKESGMTERLSRFPEADGNQEVFDYSLSF